MFAGDVAPIDEPTGSPSLYNVPVAVDDELAPRPDTRPAEDHAGGGGERKTLRYVAQYADACNMLVPDPGESRHKLEVLRGHCDEIGRDPAEIETTALLEVDLRRERPADVVRRFREQADEGIEHVIVNLPDAHVLDRLDTLGRDVIPAVGEVEPVSVR